MVEKKVIITDYLPWLLKKEDDNEKEEEKKSKSSSLSDSQIMINLVTKSQKVGRFILRIEFFNKRLK